MSLCVCCVFHSSGVDRGRLKIAVTADLLCAVVGAQVHRVTVHLLKFNWSTDNLDELVISGIDTSQTIEPPAAAAAPASGEGDTLGTDDDEPDWGSAMQPARKKRRAGRLGGDGPVPPPGREHHCPGGEELDEFEELPSDVPVEEGVDAWFGFGDDEDPHAPADLAPDGDAAVGDREVASDVGGAASGSSSSSSSSSSRQSSSSTSSISSSADRRRARRAGGGGGRAKRSTEWGSIGWTVAPIVSRKRGGLQIGWGAICSGHLNATDGRNKKCKKHFSFVNFCDTDVARVRIKLWLLEGLLIDDTDPWARRTHVKVNPRDLRLMDERAVDRMAP